MDPSDARIIKDLTNEIEAELISVGLLCRVFGRAKAEKSLIRKIENSKNKYSANGKRIQDLFGVRITLYFEDDIQNAKNILTSVFEYDEKSSSIDIPDKAYFSATRYNLIFKLPESLIDQSATIRGNSLIENTFEVQLRTVLSEGWHEVEHDLRYKCSDDWSRHTDLERALNGIYASLETSSWSMLKLFDELAHRHYKSCEWAQMIRTKFRLRAGNDLDAKVIRFFDENKEVAKELFRIDRKHFIENLIKDKVDLPVTLTNIVHLCNHYYLKKDLLTDLAPKPLLDEIRTITQ